MVILIDTVITGHFNTTVTIADVKVYSEFIRDFVASVRAAKKAGWSDEKWAVVRDDMTSGDYNTLLAAAIEHFDVS